MKRASYAKTPSVKRMCRLSCVCLRTYSHIRFMLLEIYLIRTVHTACAWRHYCRPWCYLNGKHKPLCRKYGCIGGLGKNGIPNPLIWQFP